MTKKVPDLCTRSFEKHWWAPDCSKLWHIIKKHSIQHNTRFPGALAMGLSPPPSSLATVTSVVKVWCVQTTVSRVEGEPLIKSLSLSALTPFSKGLHLGAWNMKGINLIQLLYIDQAASFTDIRHKSDLPPRLLFSFLCISNILRNLQSPHCSIPKSLISYFHGLP